MITADVIFTSGSFSEAHRISIPYGKGNKALIKLLQEMDELGYELVDAVVNLRDADGAKISIAVDDGEWKE